MIRRNLLAMAAWLGLGIPTTARPLDPTANFFGTATQDGLVAAAGATGSLIKANLIAYQELYHKKPYAFLVRTDHYYDEVLLGISIERDKFTQQQIYYPITTPHLLTTGLVGFYLQIPVYVVKRSRENQLIGPVVAISQVTSVEEFAGWAWQ